MAGQLIEIYAWCLASLHGYLLGESSHRRIIGEQLLWVVLR